MSADILYNSKITKVKFGMAGSDTNLKDSFVSVTSYDLFRNNYPYANGVYDAHLGTTAHEYKCQTCYNSKRHCLGHDGHLVLHYPVISPLAVADIRKWVKLICFNCGNPIIEDEQFTMFPRSKRLDEASKIARSSNKKCHYCKTVHPIVKKDPMEPLLLTAEFYEIGMDSKKKLVDKYKLYPHMIKDVLDRITDETVIKLGKNPSSHPRNFVLSVAKVPPTSIRPDVKKVGGGRSNNDDITTMLLFIIKKNEVISTTIPQVIDQKLEKAIFELNNAYYDLIKGGAMGRSVKAGSAQLNSIALRLRGKQGRFRKNQMGKRVRNMGRSTITGDPSLKLWELGVPLEFAKNLQFTETVLEYNKKRLLTYVQNGRAKYPGCTKIVKKSTGTEHGIESLMSGKAPIELENGDVIYRDMITGDPVGYNRQPSLMLSNITTLRAVVCEDPNILTLRMNVMLCPLNKYVSNALNGGNRKLRIRYFKQYLMR